MRVQKSRWEISAEIPQRKEPVGARRNNPPRLLTSSQPPRLLASSLSPHLLTSSPPCLLAPLPPRLLTSLAASSPPRLPPPCLAISPPRLLASSPPRRLAACSPPRLLASAPPRSLAASQLGRRRGDGLERRSAAFRQPCSTAWAHVDNGRQPEGRARVLCAQAIERMSGVASWLGRVMGASRARRLCG